MAQAPSTARIRQRRRQRLLLALAMVLLLLGGAAYLYSRPEQPKPQTRPEGSVAIPVAGITIPMGTTISQRLLRIKFVPPAQVPDDAVIIPARFERRIAMREIKAGEYLAEAALSEEGAPSGFSGLAKPGKRVLVVETNRISGTTGFVNVGDHLDVLAVGWASATTTAPGGPRPSTASIAGGGNSPGDPNAAGRQATAGSVPGEATLVAEDAVVLLAPPKIQERGRRNTYAVLQMVPADAHTTALALGSGANLRFVFRPFNEEVRVVNPGPLEQTTYPPRDARSIEVISGTSRKIQSTWTSR